MIDKTKTLPSWLEKKMQSRSKVVIQKIRIKDQTITAELLAEKTDPSRTKI